jgi:DtxR family Mn-dependent transcriptional regulator
MVSPVALTATLEDYIEAVGKLIRDKGVARVRDIARELKVHKSTVTSALKNLAERGLVNYEPYEMTTLTPRGEKAAREIGGRHRVIHDFLLEVLCVEESAADENACRMEHVMDREVLARLALFARFVKTCPRAGEDWIRHFKEFIADGGRSPDGVRDLERHLAELNMKLEEMKP